MLQKKFERRAPSDQTAIDIFANCWTGKIEDVVPGVVSGDMHLFNSDDNRPLLAMQHLSLDGNSLQGMHILELGPLEGAHSYQLSKLGATKVTAVEANGEAFLKCLIVKEILGMPNVRFLYGDCLKYLDDKPGPFDMIFCSGILYHMEDPYELIKAITLNSDRVFLYTHYYSRNSAYYAERSARLVVRDDIELTYYEHTYDTSDAGDFTGGNMPKAAWMTKSDIEKCFDSLGFVLSIHEDNDQFSWIRATARRAQ